MKSYPYRVQALEDSFAWSTPTVPIHGADPNLSRKHVQKQAPDGLDGLNTVVCLKPSHYKSHFAFVPGVHKIQVALGVLVSCW